MFGQDEMCVVYRGDASRRARRADIEILAQVELHEALAALFWDCAGMPDLPETRTFDDRAARLRLLDGVKVATARRLVRLREDYCASLDRRAVPDWAEAELQRRVEADADLRALADLGAALHAALSDATLHVRWVPF
jgi:hypothetical protein